MCIGVGTDGTRAACVFKKIGKPTIESTRTAFSSHIKPDLTLRHDRKHSHRLYWVMERRAKRPSIVESLPKMQAIEQRQSLSSRTSKSKKHPALGCLRPLKQSGLSLALETVEALEDGWTKIEVERFRVYLSVPDSA